MPQDNRPSFGSAGNALLAAAQEGARPIPLLRPTGNASSQPYFNQLFGNPEPAITAFFQQDAMLTVRDQISTVFGPSAVQIQFVLSVPNQLGLGPAMEGMGAAGAGGLRFPGPPPGITSFLPSFPRPRPQIQLGGRPVLLPQVGFPGQFATTQGSVGTPLSQRFPTRPPSGQALELVLPTPIPQTIRVVVLNPEGGPPLRQATVPINPNSPYLAGTTITMEMTTTPVGYASGGTSSGIRTLVIEAGGRRVYVLHPERVPDVYDMLRAFELPQLPRPNPSPIPSASQWSGMPESDWDDWDDTTAYASGSVSGSGSSSSGGTNQ